MINKFIFNVLLLFSITSYPLHLLAQAPGCPDIDAGPDLNLACSNSCTDLRAVLKIGIIVILSVVKNLKFFINKGSKIDASFRSMTKDDF